MTLYQPSSRFDDHPDLKDRNHAAGSPYEPPVPLEDISRPIAVEKQLVDGLRLVSNYFRHQGRAPAGNASLTKFGAFSLTAAITSASVV